MTEREREEMSKGPDDLQRAFEEGWEISEDDFEETQELTEAPVRKNGSAQKNESAQKNGNVHKNATAQKSAGAGSDIHKRQSSGKRRPEAGRSKGSSGSASRTRAAAGQKRGKKRRRKEKGFSAMDGVIGLTGAAVLPVCRIHLQLRHVRQSAGETGGVLCRCWGRAFSDFGRG